MEERKGREREEGQQSAGLKMEGNTFIVLDEARQFRVIHLLNIY